MAVVRFRTISQAILFQNELVGQISDGFWENFNRRDHWKPWSDCDVEVGLVTGRDFRAPYDRYNFVNKDLLEVVGERMLKFVRLGLAFGREAVPILDFLLDLNGEWRGMPSGTEDYWARGRERAEAFLLGAGKTVEDVRQIVEDDSVYNKKQLLADLRKMKQIIRNRITVRDIRDDWSTKKDQISCYPDRIDY